MKYIIGVVVVIVLWVVGSAAFLEYLAEREIGHRRRRW
jgi:hypothetical protein